MSKSRPSRRSTIALFVAAAGVTSVFFIDICNLIYRCGCQSLWAGAAQHCNIHHAAGPHCPWCSVGLAGAGAIYVAILAAQAAALLLLPARTSVAIRLAAALLTFPAAAAGVGLAMGIWMGYWR